MVITAIFNECGVSYCLDIREVITMDAIKLTRLNCLFEKALDNNAKLVEQHELKQLYNEYVNEGRNKNKSKVTTFPLKAVRTAI